MSKKKREVTSSIRGSITQFSWSNIADAIVNEYMAVIGNYLARV